VRKRLNQSICRLGCGLGWAKESTSSIVFSRLRQCPRRHSTVSCTKMAELIDLPFGLWTRVSRRKHKFYRIRQVAPMCSYGRAHWRHLANTIEPSVCSGNVALRQITLTTCYLWPLPLRPWYRQQSASRRILCCGHSTQYSHIVITVQLITPDVFSRLRYDDIVPDSAAVRSGRLLFISEPYDTAKVCGCLDDK